ncbi:hypothetical protein BgiMline_016503 [Biomphalaria glabrata]|uniref:Uncharacterized protein LOC106076726 n=1 Tax=Biomphalaria glabrata TaxID=6526 RepID=A0A9U8ELA7_BIOGL|nr:uncharacterized protein LOC106076726 [Biomphalaria glabrata]KAI8758684.1 galanin-like G-protein coupled receptor npr-9 isoform X1 [Biomphalaria glabrata]KAI8792191.1 galanin G-protein coupled receptor npr-9 isoform X1 [Biomphalaria glabrata]
MTTILSPTLAQMAQGLEERIIFYNVSIILGENNRTDLSLSHQHHNDSFEEVTLFSNIQRTPVGSAMPFFSFPTVLKNLDDFVMPVAFCLGILCTFMLILTFMCTPIKSSALSHYLTALGIADLIYMSCCLLSWVSKRSYDFYNKMGFCQITFFSLLLSRFLSTWYLFAAHAERFVVHFGSCRARKWCSTFRTKCIIIVIFVFSLVGFSHYIWVANVSENKKGGTTCAIMQESIKYIVELGKVEIITAIFLPMILIIAIDVAVCTSIAATYSKTFFSRAQSRKGDGWRGEYKLANSERSNSPSTRSGDATPPPPEFDLSLEKTRATVVVLIAGVIFICLILPASIYRAKILFMSSERPTPQDINMMVFFEECVKFNSIYKFFLYLPFLRAFRHGLLQLFKGRLRRKNDPETYQETSV